MSFGIVETLLRGRSAVIARETTQLLELHVQFILKKNSSLILKLNVPASTKKLRKYLLAHKGKFNVIRVLRGVSRGPSSSSLLLVVRSMIVSVLTWGVIFFFGANKNHLKALDTIFFCRYIFFHWAA